MLSQKIIGTWKLISIVSIDENGLENDYFGVEPAGIISYDSFGNMMAQLHQSNRPSFHTEDWAKGSDEEIRNAFVSYQAYYGTYEINEQESYVTHHVKGAIFPNWVGHSEKRFFKFVGKQIHLTTPVIEVKGKEFTFLAIWEKEV
ncbi:MAG: hypothetical protein ACI85I_002199 [Arenicella sp.]|jgi:hypothetical protein